MATVASSHPEARPTTSDSRSVRGPERNLLRVVTHELPEPVADAGTAFFADARSSSPDWFRAFHRLIDAFEVSVSFAALLAALSYVRSGVRSASATQAIEALRDQSKLSTGFWWLLLRECLRPFEGNRDALFWPGLYDLYFRGDGKVQSGARLLDAVPGLRNRLKGHAFTLPAGRYQAVVAEQTPVLEDLLTSLQGLAAHPLVRVMAVDVEGDTSLANLELRAGSSFRAGRFTARLLGQPTVGELILLRATGDSEAREWMSLHPFVVHRTLVDELGVSEVALFQGRAGEAAGYLAVRSGARFDLDRAGAEVVRALAPSRTGRDPSRALRSADGKIAVADVADAAAAATDAFVLRARQERVYIPEAFTDRRRIRAHVHAFLDGDRRLAILAGAAGAGKTSLMCRLAEDLRIAKPSSPVVLVAAAGLPTSREPLRDAIARVLALPDGLGKGLARWGALPWPGTPSDIVLFVDGLDRAEDRTALLRSLLDLGSSETRLRIVVSVAAAVLEGLLASGALNEAKYVYRTEEGLYGGSAIVVAPLEADEVEAAYDRYRSLLGSSPITPFEALSPTLRAALANPLLLRITCEVFDRKDVAADVTEVDVLIEHARRTAFADPARQDFVKRLVRRLASTRRRRVALRELLDDAFTRPAILATEGAYQALLKDQVLVEVQGRSAGLGLAPETFVEFSFDATLGYLLLLDYLDREETQLPNIIAELASVAPQFAPAAVALDIALRSTPPRERADLVVRILEGAAHPLGADIVARFLDWLDAPARASLQPVIDTILEEGGLTPSDQQAEILQQVAEVFGTEPAPARAPSASAGFVTDLIESGRLPSDRWLDLALALHRRNATLLAGLVAHLTLRRSFDELPGLRRREAELVLCDALRKVGSDGALQAAESVCTKTCENARAAKHDVHLRRGLLLLETLYELLEKPGPRLEACDALLAITPEPGPDMMLAMSRRANALAALGRHDDAKTARVEVARLLESFPAGREAGEALATLEADVAEGDREALYHRTIAQLQAGGDMEREAIQHRVWAWRLMHQGRLEEAERVAKHALALAATAGAAATEQHCWTTVASVYRHKGEFDRSRDIFLRAGRAALALGRLSRVSYVLGNYGVLMADIGNFGECLRLDRLTRPIMDLRERTGLDLREGKRLSLSNESELTCTLGDPQRAELLAREACSLDAQLPKPFSLPYVNLAVALARSGRPEEALPPAERGRELAVLFHQRTPLFESARALAEVYVGLGRSNDAIALLRSEIEASDHIGEEMHSAPLRVQLAEVLLSVGALPEAFAEVEAAEAVYVKQPQMAEHYRSTFVLSRILTAMASSDTKKAVKLRERARGLLQRAGEELNAAVARFASSPYRLTFLRRNPVARAIREATEESVSDDALAESAANPDASEPATP